MLNLSDTKTLALTRTFPLPADDTGAAQSWIELGQRAPRTARLASSVVLLRDTENGPEALLGYRRGESPLGKVSFPGGSVLENDGDAAPWAGPSPTQWAQQLGINDSTQARKIVTCAIRELFEETGILLAEDANGIVVESNSGPEWMKLRMSLAADEVSFGEILGNRGLKMRTDMLKPLARWLSPDFAHKRFDTMYFSAVAPLGQKATPLEGKGTWLGFVPAAELIDQRNTSALGDLVNEDNTRGRTMADLMTPATQIVLEKLAVARGCVAYLANKRQVCTFQPELIENDGELFLEVLPQKGFDGTVGRSR